MDVDLISHQLTLIRIKVGMKYEAYLIITSVQRSIMEHRFFSSIYIFNHITDVNCIWAQWGSWDQSSKTCGDGGSKQRTWHKTRVEENEGTCDGQPSETKQDCAYDWGTNGYPLQRKKYSYIIKVIWVKFAGPPCKGKI